MTDSENENILSYPSGGNTTVSARGPNTNISNLSIRQQLTSTMYNMPRNFERQRYAQSVCDQRSMYRRETSPMSVRSTYMRETSPMSIRSAYDMRPYNFQPYYSRMNTRQSMNNGRGGSPMSLRSIDSSASVSAKDIAFAFKNTKFNSHDIQIIKHAYQNLMKFRTRERFERKRNLRVFSKGRMKSGEDSGEQASDSSISGDDSRSAKTTISKVSNTMSNMQFDFSHARRPEKINNVRDCAGVNQNTIKNMFSLGSAIVNSSVQSNNAFKQNNLLKDRFKSSFLLPSQRFNQSVAATLIPENCEKQHKRSKNIQNTTQQVKNHIHQRPLNNNINTESEDEEIFAETVKENTVNIIDSRNKRSFSEDELSVPYNKKRKISSPSKNMAQKFLTMANNKGTNNFEFIKPSLPAKKGKPKIQEKLISKSSQPQEELIAKSSQPLIDIEGPNNTTTTGPSKQPQVHEKTSTSRIQAELPEKMDTDISMRPSFIKRKLFTQSLDVIEKSNASNDSVNSPQSSIYGGQQKEKNKARKLVTTQSYLNREVHDDNNLMDLIHKIVPKDQMNATSQSSVTQIRTNTTKPVADENKDIDKWDITSIISMCNDDDCSDTYTDEEVLKSDSKMTDVNPECAKAPPIRPCRVDLFKIPELNNKQQINKDLNNKSKLNDMTTNKLQNCAKSFWDTDTESDFEWPLYRSNLKENKQPGIISQQQETKNPGKNVTTANTTTFPDITKSLHKTAVNATINRTTDNVQKLKVGNVSFRSHRLTKKKMCCNETCTSDTKSAIEPPKKYPIDTSKPVKKQVSSLKSNSKSENNNKTAKDSVQSKPTEENALNKDRSASNTTKKPIDKTKLKTDVTKKTANNKSKLKSNTDSRVDKSLKIVRNKSPKTKVIKTSERNNNDVKTKNTNSSNPPNTSTNLDSTADAVQNTSTSRQRPLRSCRVSSQNRSVEVSTSMQVSNNSSFSKSLRSRTIINLSSSIDNITLHIKPRSRVVNKTVALKHSRKSDVSFSLGNKHATTPVKIARNKGKR